MRKFILYPLIALSISFTACDDSEACDAVILADLAFDSGVVAALVQDQSSGTYQISSTLINALAESCDDGSNVQRADASTLKQQIFYSASPNFTTKKVIDDFNFNTPALGGGERNQDLDEIQFLQDGYYLIERYSDFAKQVHERDENNNISQSNNSHNLRTSSNVIEIRNHRTNTNGQYIKRIHSYSIKK